VAKDFHYRSLHAEIYPLALFGPVRPPRYVASRITPEDVPGTLAALQSTWKQFSDLPFEYAFLADDLEAQYRAEDRLTKVFGVFAGLAILIGCLGLFGLAAFMAAQRTKEIGIRKVLGATVGSLIALLSKDFLKLVVVAFVIAAPLAYVAMTWWLEDFAYRVGIAPMTFIGAGLLALFIALATVSYQAIRTAVANPVDSLRYE
jgi:putative ABC transport system permease protein